MNIKNKIIKIIIIPAIATAIIVGTFYATDRMIIAVVAKKTGLEVSYASLSRNRKSVVTIGDLKIRDPRRKIGLRSKASRITFSPLALLFSPHSLSIPFELHGVSFTNAGARPAQTTYENLFLYAFDSRWRYSTISGSIATDGRRFTVSDFFAASEDIILLLNGTLFEDGTINADITIRLSRAIQKDLPGEVLGAFEDDEKGWKRIALELKGNPKSPSIQLKSKTFRLRLGL